MFRPRNVFSFPGKSPCMTCSVRPEGRTTDSALLIMTTPEFAYLSAAIATATMQSVGFRFVIETMWVVDDSETNKVMSRVICQIITRVTRTRASNRSSVAHDYPARSYPAGQQNFKVL